MGGASLSMGGASGTHVYTTQTGSTRRVQLPRAMSSLLMRFLSSDSMTDPEFRQAKQEFRELRAESVKHMAQDMPGVADWLLQPGKPTTPPPEALIIEDRERSGMFSVNSASGGGFKGPIIFCEGDMITHAYNLAQSKDVAVLNMANATIPGGGFLSGARAQEEQLCHRASSLFLRLKLFKHNNEEYISESTCLVTPQVDILRNGFIPDSEPFAMCPPVSVTVLSAAAKRYHSLDEAKADGTLLDRMVRTWKAVLSAASASRTTHLVVSALGCGAFNNPPRVVGTALAVALRSCNPGNNLEEVHVVIMEDHNSNGVNFDEFRQGFHGPNGFPAGSSGSASKRGRDA